MRKSLTVAAAAAALMAVSQADRSEARSAHASGQTQLAKPAVRLERIGFQRTRRMVRFRVRGELRVPAGVAPDQACTGGVAITVRRGGRSVATGGTQLRANCRFSRRLSISRRLLGRARLLKVRATFSGNAVLYAARRTRAVRIRR
jgi:hypothetical protein